jgi:hypothetical protein
LRGGCCFFLVQIESRSLDDGLRAEAQAAGQRRSERQRSFDARAMQVCANSTDSVFGMHWC